MNKSVRYAPEVRERAVWMVLEHLGYSPHTAQNYAALGQLFKQPIQVRIPQQRPRPKRQFVAVVMMRSFVVINCDKHYLHPILRKPL